MASFQIFKQHRDGIKGLAARGIEIATIAASNSEYAVYTEDQEALTSVTDNVMRNRDVSFVQILGNRSQVLISDAHERLIDIPGFLKSIDSNVYTTGSFQEFRLPGRKSGFISVQVPIITRAEVSGMDNLGPDDSNIDKTIGYLRCILSQDNLDHQLNADITTIISVTGAIVLIGIFITFILTKRITSPLKSLVYATNRIAKGDFDQKISSSTQHEIQELVESFNMMTDDLIQARQEIQNHQHDLETKIRDRTREISEKNITLSKTIKEVEISRNTALEASKAKSEFLATMSHEIRTPLNGVIGMAEALSRTPLEKNQVRFLDTISSSGTSLLAIINDILDFSKIEAGKLELNFSQFDLRKLLESVCDLYSSEADKKGVELVCKIDADLAMMAVGDVVRIRQIFI